jgi:hypothetical protein
MAIQVYKLIKLGRDGKNYSEKFKEVKRTGVKLDEATAEEYNKDKLQTGRYYELDEKETEKRNKSLTKNQKND